MPRKDDEARAEVEREFMASQAATQRENLERTHRMLEEQRLLFEAQRRENERREDAESERAERAAEAMRKQVRADQEAARAREDQQRRENESSRARTVEEGQRELERQAGLNREETARSVSEHQNVLRNVTGRIADEEKKTAATLVQLTEQKRADKEKLHAEKEEYNERKMTETKEHHRRVEELEEKKTAILGEREENRLMHAEQMDRLKIGFAAQQAGILIAGENDRTERNFADVVNNTRTVGSQVSRDLSSIGALASQIRRNGGVSERTVNINKSSCEQAVRTIDSLAECAQLILNSTETKNAAVGKCQDIARNISTKASELRGAVSDLLSDLRDNYQEDLERKVNVVSQLQQDLLLLTNSLPVVPRTDHQVNAIMRSVQAIGNVPLSVGTTSERPAIKQ